MYRVISSEKYRNEDVRVLYLDDDGVEVTASKWQISHPNAVHSPDGREYILSNTSEGMTHEEVQKHIAENW